MNHECPNCRVQISSQITHCPLCGKYIGALAKDTAPLYAVPPYQQLRRHEERLLFHWSLFFSVVALILVWAINLWIPHWNDPAPWAWSVIPTVIILYVWILIRHTILSKASVGKKIGLQTISLSLFSFIIEESFGSISITFSYVIPFLLTAAIITLFVLFHASKNLWKNDTGIIFFLILLGFVLPFVPPIKGHFLWTHWVVLGTTLFSFLGIVFISWGKLIDLIKRFFHL